MARATANPRRRAPPPRQPPVLGVHGAGDSRARTGIIYRWLIERTTIGVALRDPTSPRACSPRAISVAGRPRSR
jgi:hypothetical protein